MLDLAVVGGGPAGLVTALTAARAGMSVAVSERRDGTVDKACGEGLMPGALRALQRLGVDPPGRTISGITYRQGSRAVTARFRDGAGRGVRRTDLHEALRTAVADAGVRIEHRAVGPITQYHDHVEIADIRANYVVAADGLHSRTRAELGLAAETPGRPRWGQRQHFAVAPWTDTVEVTWSGAAECYVTPIGDDVVGVAVLSSRRAAFAEQLAAFSEVQARLAGATPASTVRGAGPLRQRVRHRVAGRVLLVGDAAGYVDALTGEGLAVSFAAATELVDCLLADRPADYDARWARVTRRSRWLTGGLLRVRHSPLAPTVVPLACATPALFGAVVRQLAR